MRDGAATRAIRLRVSNLPGVLARVALVFARRGCNIDRLVAAEQEGDPAFSLITITVRVGEATAALLLGQLDRLVDVIEAREVEVS